MSKYLAVKLHLFEATIGISMLEPWERTIFCEDIFPFSISLLNNFPENSSNSSSFFVLLL